MNTSILLFLFKLVINEPYALTVTTLTPDLLSMCQADENCIDIVAIKDEPKDCFTYKDLESDESGACCEANNETLCVNTYGNFSRNEDLTISQIIECDTDFDCCVKNPTIDREFCEGKI